MTEDLRTWVSQKLKEKSWSHRELARRGGCSNTLISDALKGARPITLDFCLAVSKGLSEPLWNVLQMGGLIDDVPLDLIADGEVRALISKYNLLPPEGKLELKTILGWLTLKYNI